MRKLVEELTSESSDDDDDADDGDEDRDGRMVKNACDVAEEDLHQLNGEGEEKDHNKVKGRTGLESGIEDERKDDVSVANNDGSNNENDDENDDGGGSDEVVASSTQKKRLKRTVVAISSDTSSEDDQISAPRRRRPQRQRQRLYDDDIGVHRDNEDTKSDKTSQARGHRIPEGGDEEDEYEREEDSGEEDLPISRKRSSIVRHPASSELQKAKRDAEECEEIQEDLEDLKSSLRMLFPAF